MRSSQWPSSKVVAFAASFGQMENKNSSFESNSFEQRQQQQQRPYTLHVPVRSLVLGAAAVSCGARTLEEAAALRAPWHRRGEEEENVPVAVPLMAPVNQHKHRQHGNGYEEELEMVALLSESTPFADAIHSVLARGHDDDHYHGHDRGGRQIRESTKRLRWRLLAAELARYTAGSSSSISPFSPLPQAPFSLRPTSEAQECVVGEGLRCFVRLTSPLFAGTGTVMSTSCLSDSSFHLPADLAEHPLWRAVFPLFSDRVRAHLGGSTGQ
mmetsp:Transcript_47874/g.94931  ORF Transcript_47874/g.94931 Transcript_47874/m.94931 type:complete len:269 (+) Transcript_47874:3-809(+)